MAGALHYHFGGQLSTTGGPTRPGIVHRLDRDTSGVILVAKNDIAHAKLAAQFEGRTIKKEYYALVVGAPQRDRDVIEEPIGMHPRQRDKMAIHRHDPNARRAETYFEVVERFVGFAALRVSPKTGRTHQIRVHLDHIGCPVLCDRLYGGRARITLGEIRRDPQDERVPLGATSPARPMDPLHPSRNRPGNGDRSAAAEGHDGGAGGVARVSGEGEVRPRRPAFLTALSTAETRRKGLNGSFCDLHPITKCFE